MEAKILNQMSKQMLGEKMTFLKNAFSRYRDRQDFRIDRINYAKTISCQELENRLEDLKKKQSPTEIIRLLHSAANSGIWLGHSYYKLLATSLDFKQAIHDLEFTEEDEQALELLAKGDNKKVFRHHTPQEVFSVIFKELDYSYRHPTYKPQISAEPISSTIVLVSGVLNEIFSTPAFERAAAYFYKKLGIKYICPEVRGTKGIDTNVKLLEKQLYEYIDMNPGEKLWIIGFSKGGVDALHFLKHNKKFAEKYIAGFSAIACPILGSNHTDHKILKALNFLHDFSESKNIPHQDILFKEIYQSLSASYQKSWFKNNYKNLPKLPFYTAVALESSWYESHIWMVLTKSFFQSSRPNDGIVDVDHALFPGYFRGLNFGIYPGHHLIGQRSSHYPQEALIEAHIITLSKMGVLT